MTNHDITTIILIIILILDIILIYKHLKNDTYFLGNNLIIILIIGIPIYLTIGTHIWGLPINTINLGNDPWGDNSAIQLPAIIIASFPGLLITWIIEQRGSR